MLISGAKKVVIGLIFAVVWFFILQRFAASVTGLPETVASIALYPVLLVERSIAKPIQNFFQNKQTVQELQQELAQLQEVRTDLLAEIIKLHSTLWHGQQTQEMATFRERYDVACAILGHVMLRQFTPQGHFYLIDVGQKRGVEKNMVAVHKNLLLGKVVEVYPYYSKICLITDPACKVAAYCSATKAHGIHEGTMQENATALKFVSHLESLQVGDLVLSNGEGLIFPQGFALGAIKEYQVDQLHYCVVVEPLIDLRKVEYCYLINKS